MIRVKLALISVIVGTLSTLLCPFLKVFLVGNWNLYEVDPILFYVTNGLFAFILLFTLLKSARLFRFFSILFAIWSVLAPLAVFFKTNNYFGMKLADGLISKTISFQWGWLVLIFCAVLFLFSKKNIEIKK